MNLVVRNERPGDEAAIQRVIEAAFPVASSGTCVEVGIVDALRASGALVVSQVAERDGVIIGHVAMSPVTVSDDSGGWFGLGPIAVSPEHQQNGTGSRLMRAALERLEAMGAAGCVLVGEPAFYERFGFRNVSGFEYPGIPARYFQGLRFTGPWPSGMVTYHDAFLAEG